MFKSKEQVPFKNVAFKWAVKSAGYRNKISYYLQFKYNSKKGIIYQFCRLCIFFHKNNISLLRLIREVFSQSSNQFYRSNTNYNDSSYNPVIEERENKSQVLNYSSLWFKVKRCTVSKAFPKQTNHVVNVDINALPARESTG